MTGQGGMEMSDIKILKQVSGVSGCCKLEDQMENVLRAFLLDLLIIILK